MRANRGADAISKGVSDAYDSWKDGEVDDCAAGLRQAERDCLTLQKQIEEMRLSIEQEHTAAEDDRETPDVGDSHIQRRSLGKDC